MNKKQSANISTTATEAQAYIKSYKLGLSKVAMVSGRTRVNNASEWTEEELEKLKTYYPTGGYKKCQEEGVNKTMYNITSTAAMLGIKRISDTKDLKELNKVRVASSNNKASNPNAADIKSGNMCPMGWTKEEIQILMTYYPDGGTRLCQEKGLNKKNSTIRMMAKSLGITLDKNKGWTKEEDELLEKTFKKHNTKESCYEVFSNKTKTAINARLKELDLVLKKRWSKKEVEILKKYFPIGGARLVIENGVNRGTREIGAKASNMNIRLNKSRKTWTVEEEQILEKYYPEEGMNVIKRLNGIDELCIRNKVRHMGLAGPANRWSDEEIDILKKYYPLEGGKVSERLPGKTVASIYYKASILNLKTVK